MIKNLSIYATNEFIINKKVVHKIVGLLKKELNLTLLSLNINFLSSEDILYLNRKYLNHDFTTDIITFKYSKENDSLDGEILISYRDAYFNSQKYHVSLDLEILRLIIHGILHLVGFDDKTPKDKKVMKNLENKLVNKLKNIFENKIILNYDGKNC